MDDFIINGIVWKVRFVNSNSPMLMRSDGSMTIGMTDGNTHTVYLYNGLSSRYLEKVLSHEVCHCICFSYDISMPIEQEELLAEWVSLYGREVINVVDNLLSNKLAKEVG